MKPSMAKILRIFFIVLAVLLSLLSLPMLVVEMGMFILCLIGAAFCFFMAHDVKKKYIPSRPNNTVEAKTETVPDGQMNYNLFEEIVESSILQYEYETEFFLSENALEHINGNGGKGVTFVRETNNAYDSAAVAIYLNDHKLGYVYRGGIQDMINDWIKRKHFFIGYINKYSVANKSATIKIGFYKPLDSFPSYETTLVKTKKKIDEYTTREDNLDSCEAGDVVTIEFDSCENQAIVYDDFYQQIGELPIKALTFCEEYENRDIKGIITACEYNEDTEKHHVTVELFAIPQKK